MPSKRSKDGSNSATGLDPLLIVAVIGGVLAVALGVALVITAVTANTGMFQLALGVVGGVVTTIVATVLRKLTAK